MLVNKFRQFVTMHVAQTTTNELILRDQTGSAPKDRQNIVLTLGGMERTPNFPLDHGTKQILLLACGGAKRSTNVPHVKKKNHNRQSCDTVNFLFLSPF